MNFFLIFFNSIVLYLAPLIFWVIFDSLPETEGIYAMVMACVYVCVCDALACKHDISRSKSSLNFKLGTLVGLGE